MIDWQALALLLLSVVCAIGGSLLRAMWEAVDKLKTSLGQLEADLPNRYVRRDDYRDDMRELKSMVSEIWQAMKEKADKS